ncbi:hypothetical protein ACR6C2_37435 [Streptomyces sp. INA 01156]
MTVLNGQSVSDEATARDTIWDLVQQDGFGGTEPACPRNCSTGGTSTPTSGGAIWWPATSTP